MNQRVGKPADGCPTGCAHCSLPADMAEGTAEQGQLHGWAMVGVSAGAFLIPLALAIVGAVLAPLALVVFIDFRNTPLPIFAKSSASCSSILNDLTVRMPVRSCVMPCVRSASFDSLLAAAVRILLRYRHVGKAMIGISSTMIAASTQLRTNEKTTSDTS